MHSIQKHEFELLVNKLRPPNNWVMKQHNFARTGMMVCEYQREENGTVIFRTEHKANGMTYYWSAL